ncbi:Leucine-rich repeat serine/threonine-protein kinase 2 [Phytophthora pseudosyringae]|uniref:Leucine-rich repeat serine/threonine-protein kinase 2 n=1 Tax=Phytophthora pseudosyringae TaxID=221518 RepID=A0A8T1VKZ4_9STRA|nr:Leucine-rich repeat serine/threonine-protein kinase 2 [Phytophthora pseudosyringae]
MASSPLSQARVPRLHVPLSVALSDAERLTRCMAEAETLCARVTARLSSLSRALEAAPASVRDAFLWQTFRFHDFLSRFSGKKLVTRLVCTRKVLEQTRSLHRELDAVSEAVDDVPVANWEPQWLEDRRVLREGWEGLRQDRASLAAELLDAASQVEAMVLLRCETETYFAKYAPDELELLNAVFGYAASLSRAEVPHVPRWFIPPHEVAFAEAPFSKGAFGSVHHGTWLDARVVVKRMLSPVESEMERGVFMNEIKIWYFLNYPHVVKLHGACHVGRPFFVCELASNGILTDYTAREEREGRRVLWQKLHEVALGLHFLHERNVTHGDLKGNNILVGADGTAKLTDFGLSSMLTSSTEPTPVAGTIGALRWKAPEVLSGASVSSYAADIYSFGMSIIEAATHALPWGNQMPDSAVRYHVVKMRALPPRPECLSDEQWELVEKMCAFEPAQRPEVALVVEKLKQFAEIELNEILGHTGSSFSFYASSDSDRSLSVRTASNASAAAVQSQSARLSSAAASSQSSGRTFSSSTCSISTQTGKECMPPVLDLHEYLDLLATLIDTQCEAIDEICVEAKDLQLTEPEDFIKKRYDDRLLQLRSEWLARHRVTQDTLTTCMLMYEDQLELQTTREALQQKLQQHASEAVKGFNGLVDPARAF